MTAAGERPRRLLPVLRGLLRRVGAAGAGRRRPSGWALGAPVVFALAGLLATASAQAAHGTDLRSTGRTDTADVIREQQHRADQEEAQVARLRQQVAALTEQAAPAGSQLARLDDEAATAARAAGTVAVRGSGVAVTLDDAPHAGGIPSGFTADDLLVHQQDVQAVVNALWSAGAEAMTLMDQRVVSTSAVRCVGNVLILQGRVYSPPYVIRAVGDRTRLLAGLRAAPAVAVYRQYVDAVGLGYRVQSVAAMTAPAFDGALQLEHARVPREQRR